MRRAETPRRAIARRSARPWSAAGPVRRLAGGLVRTRPDARRHRAPDRAWRRADDRTGTRCTPAGRAGRAGAARAAAPACSPRLCPCGAATVAARPARGGLRYELPRDAGAVEPALADPGRLGRAGRAPLRFPRARVRIGVAHGRRGCPRDPRWPCRVRAPRWGLQPVRRPAGPEPGHDDGADAAGRHTGPDAFGRPRPRRAVVPAAPRGPRRHCCGGSPVARRGPGRHRRPRGHAQAVGGRRARGTARRGPVHDAHRAIHRVFGHFDGGAGPSGVLRRHRSPGSGAACRHRRAPRVARPVAGCPAERRRRLAFR